MGVAFRLGAKAERLRGADRPSAGPVALAAGAAVDADLVFPAMGAAPANALTRDLPGAELDPLGRVRVDPSLRPAGRTNVFALGDAAAAGDLMTIVAITRQAPWLAKCLKAVVADRRIESLPAYAPWPAPPILIPLGPRRGASVLPLTKSGPTVGGFLTSLIKGKTLFIPRYRMEFGVK